jgi:ferric-dicitrate binding protein FerR (iron transport regulator)
MTPNQEHLDQLFRQFMDGKASQEETHLLWQWVFLLDARQQKILYSAEEETAIREEMRTVILQHVVPRRKIFPHILRYVAAAAVLLFAAFFLFRPSGFMHHGALAAVESNDSSIRSFYLPDSTHVILNLSSRLEWNDDFNEHERKVSLTGEGYFEVHHDPAHPFIVESNGISTRALGTAFNIESYHGEGEIRVSLLEGKVSVTSNMFQPATLQPGQLLRYSHAQKNMLVEQIGVNNAIAWTEGGMTFNRIPLKEALNRLAKRYRITIQYNPEKMQGKTVSGSFNASQWEKLLPNILFIHDLHYEVKDSLITVY